MSTSYDQMHWFVFNRVQPPCDGEYIVTIRNGIRATVLTYENGHWYNDSRRRFDVVAWMFLPGAYKPGKN